MGLIKLVYPLPTNRQPLTITDNMYGTVTLNPKSEGLLIDLIKSPSFQRLKEVHQHGISSVCGLLPGEPVNRFDHSVGAMLLVRKLGASLEEQAAALLHDVAHTALSHVVDNVFDRVVHEKDKMHFLDQTDLPDIITAHGFNPEHIFEETNFSLLERDAPSLCADRVDYGCRDSVAFGFLTQVDAKEISDDLVDYQGEMCFQSQTLARKLADVYMKSDAFAWSNPTHGALYYYAANTIREAFKEKELEFDGLWTDADNVFWTKMVESMVPNVRELASKVNKDIRAVDPNTPAQAGSQFIEYLPIKSKARVLDPMVLLGPEDGSNRRRKLSEVDSEYKINLEVYRESKREEKTWRIEKLL